MQKYGTEVADQFDRLVRERHSTRGFLPDRIDEATLEKVFDTARWAPSGTNVQPWHVCVASGEVCESLRQGFLERYDRGDKVVTDHAPDGRTGAPWQDRKRACAGHCGAPWVSNGKTSPVERLPSGVTTSFLMHPTPLFSVCMNSLAPRRPATLACLPRRCCWPCLRMALPLARKARLETTRILSARPLVCRRKSKYSTASALVMNCLLYTSPSPRDATLSRMPSSA